MNIIEKLNIKQYHQYRIQQENYSPANMQGWTSEAEQQARFEAILSLADFNDQSVLDIGCGFGDFKNALDKVCKKVNYIGIDQQAAFINFAKEKYKETANTWFYEADISRCQLPKVDLVVASGVLSYFSTDPDFHFNMITQFYKAAGTALIFNMLDKQTFESGQLIIGHDKEKVLSYCRQLCPNTTIKTGYTADDFTIKMACP